MIAGLALVAAGLSQPAHADDAGTDITTRQITWRLKAMTQVYLSPLPFLSVEQDDNKKFQLRVDNEMSRKLPTFNMVRSGFSEWLALLSFITIDVTIQGPSSILPHSFSEKVALKELARYIHNTGTIPETAEFNNYGPNDEKDFQFHGISGTGTDRDGKYYLNIGPTPRFGAMMSPESPIFKVLWSARLTINRAKLPSAWFVNQVNPFRREARR